MSQDRVFHILLAVMVSVILAGTTTMVVIVMGSLHDTRVVSKDNGKKLDAILCVVHIPPDIRTQTDIDNCLKEAP